MTPMAVVVDPLARGSAKNVIHPKDHFCCLFGGYYDLLLDLERFGYT